MEPFADFSFLAQESATNDSSNKKDWRYLENHTRTSKGLGSPPFICHEKAIWKGPTTRSLGDENDQFGY